MVDLKLEIDEGILLQTTNVGKYRGDEELELYELYLTNKSLICVYDKSTKIFLKEEIVTERLDLSSIKIVNGKVQIAKVNNADWGVGMQILLTNGVREHYIFSNNKKELQVWIDSIIDAITMKSTSTNESKEVKFEYNQQEVNSSLNTNSGKEKGVNEISSNEQNSNRKYIYCCSCGEKLNKNSKFCNVCGTPTNISEQSVKDEHHNAEPIYFHKESVNEERKVYYEGQIYKCPNCSEVLKAFTVNCPACGFEIRGSQNVSAVKELATKIESIEATRETVKTKSIIGKLYGSDGQLSKTDEQKISLIRSFTIPNNKEDIFEFMILAASNIDMKLYGLGDQGILTASQRAVSDAWLAKFEQAYQKARFAFGNSSDFVNVNEIYEKKVKEIKRKKMELPLLVIGIVSMIIVLFVFVLILVI